MYGVFEKREMNVEGTRTSCEEPVFGKDCDCVDEEDRDWEGGLLAGIGCLGDEEAVL